MFFLARPFTIDLFNSEKKKTTTENALLNPNQSEGGGGGGWRNAKPLVYFAL